jgi:hypothetical protein
MVQDDRQNKGRSTDQRAARACPICGKPVIFAYRPFCSKRCADIDLHRWLSGGYAVPAQPDGVEDDESIADEAKSGQE